MALPELIPRAGNRSPCSAGIGLDTGDGFDRSNPTRRFLGGMCIGATLRTPLAGPPSRPPHCIPRAGNLTYHGGAEAAAQIPVRLRSPRGESSRGRHPRCPNTCGLGSRMDVGIDHPGVISHVGNVHEGAHSYTHNYLRDRAPRVGNRTPCPGRGWRRAGPRLRPVNFPRRNLGMNEQSCIALYVSTGTEFSLFSALHSPRGESSRGEPPPPYLRVQQPQGWGGPRGSRAQSRCAPRLPKNLRDVAPHVENVPVAARRAAQKPAGSAATWTGCSTSRGDSPRGESS